MLGVAQPVSSRPTVGGSGGLSFSTAALGAWFGVAAAALLLAAAMPLLGAARVVGEGLAMRRGQLALVGGYMLVCAGVGYLAVAMTS